LLNSGPDSFLPDVVAAHSSEALALGRLCSLSGLSENGTPIVLNKQMLRCYWRAKNEQGSRVKDSLLLEAMESLSAPLVQYQSNPVAGFAAQVKSVPKNTNPMRHILWRGFVNPSLMEKGNSPSNLMRHILGQRFLVWFEVVIFPAILIYALFLHRACGRVVAPTTVFPVKACRRYWFLQTPTWWRAQLVLYG
jgi:hypothetical protein